MMTHFNNFGDFKVIFVTEDDATKNFKSAIDAVKQAVAVEDYNIEPEPPRRANHATV